MFDSLRFRAGHGFCTVYAFFRCRNAVGMHQVRPPEHRINNFPRVHFSLASLPEVTQMACLDFEETCFYCGGAAQPPHRRPTATPVPAPRLIEHRSPQ